MDTEEIQKTLREFARERDWEKFHSPKNLVMALAGEAGELVEVFQWLTEKESRELAPEQLALARDELADIQIYLLRIFDILGIDPQQAVESKMELNATKYPAEVARGNATKYNRR